MSFGRRYRHFKRYREIIQTFFGHGFGYLVDQAGLWEFITLKQRLFGEGSEGVSRFSRGERARQALERLGPTFIKLGQVLSTRPDLLPRDILHEMQKLQDRVPPFAFDQVAKLVEAELGHPVSEVFSELFDQPLAAASIGQVHLARLQDGEPVVVKVMRPDLDRIVRTDLEIMADLAGVFERRTDWGKYYRISEVVAEFADSLRNEMNYTVEASNADRFRRMFSGDSAVYVPRVYWDLTTTRVLTMELVEGLKINDVAAIRRAGLNPSDIARRLADAVFRQVLVEGFFHADPHPGNLFVDEHGTIIFMDFGMVGELSGEMRERFISFVTGVVNRDPDEVVEAILRMGEPLGRVNLAALKRDVYRLQKRYGEVPLREVDFGKALLEIIALAYDHRIAVPSDYSFLAKALITLESVVVELDPSLSMIDLAEPYTRLLLREQLSWTSIRRGARRGILEGLRLAAKVPKQVSGLLSLAEDGELRFKIENTDSDVFIGRLTALFNRLAMSIISGSLVVGTALILYRSDGSRLWGVPVAEYSFLVTGILGIWLVLGILRSGRF